MNWMTDQLGLFDVDDRMRELAAKDYDRERQKTLVNFEICRSDL